ncbi:MAG: AAA family ATPase [Cyanobacteriota bacterium]|nr:AAA family ATPase [Cyanobacteriota bacterium]
MISPIPPLIASLLRPQAYAHPVQQVELLETHISWVFLTGVYAYKLKKPVDLGFLNFSDPQRRALLCQEELRLNNRFGADLYLDVVPLHGPPEQASFKGDGPVIDHAVRMRQFPQGSLLTAVVDRHELTSRLVDHLADDLASFQDHAAVAAPNGPHGTAEAVWAPVQANFAVLEASPLVSNQPCSAARLQRIRLWSEREWQRQRPRFAQRLAAGRVREGHGDLHLGNLVLLGGRIVPFDSLEFSESLRWIDVINEMAFLVMDLQEHGAQQLSQRLLNRWLQQNGDWNGLSLWRWYVCYRAVVRAKVAALRDDPAAVDAYLELAEKLITPPAPLLAITTGVSGTGKSRFSREIADRLGWIQLRSDVERKRMFGLWGIPAASARFGDLYQPEVSDELMTQRLPGLTRQVIDSGFSVVVDATFLKRGDRRRMAELAHDLGVPFLILSPMATRIEALARIKKRQRDGDDPSDADASVLERQLETVEPLDSAEQRCCIRIEAETDFNDLARRIEAWCHSGC